MATRRGNLPGVLVANNLDIDGLVGAGTEDTLDEVLVHPRLKLTHPEQGLVYEVYSQGHGFDTYQRVFFACSLGVPPIWGMSPLGAGAGVVAGKLIVLHKR